ncbi:hypothetical protein IAU60_001712 [Kwoniella sp. DSM 27419]
MSRIIRRALSTFPPRAGPSTHVPSPSTLFPSASSVSSTMPLAVRRRRAERPPHAQASPSPLSDADLHDVTLPTASEGGKRFPLQLEQDYQDLLQSATFGDAADDQSLRALFLKGSAEWRSRLRGFAPRGRKGRHEFLLGVMDGTKLESEAVASEGGEVGESASPDQIVGQRIYLPNIQIRLMRNHTPPGEAYDPYVATFRIPPSMTKNDLRSYLHAVYGLKVTFIRTDNYIGEVGRTRTGEVKRKGGSSQTYKRAVVGLYEPFHYPDDMEELYAQGEKLGLGDSLAKVRDTWLQENYSIRISEEMRKRAMFKYYKGAKWRSRTHANMGNTVREIMKRRQEREDKVTEEVKRRWSMVAQDAVGGVKEGSVSAA